MKLRIKRIYDAPSATDGTRVLVDRLWPRGISKKAAHIDAWAKELAPSSALRSWFHEKPETRYAAFCKRYRSELAKQKAAGKDLMKGSKTLTLVTAVRDIEHSHIPMLVSFLEKQS